MTSRTLALDLETTTRDGYTASFEDLSCWQITAVGLGFRPTASTTPETEVLLRESPTDRGERKLLARVVNWVRKREPHDATLSFNGEAFDFPVLAQRADALLKSDRPHEQSLSFSLHDALNIDHRDLLAEIKTLQSDGEQWPTLERALDERDIPRAVATLDGEELTGAALPALGRAAMRGNLSPDEQRALIRYVESDIGPLFDLADRLAGERKQRERRIETEAAATAGQSATNTGTGTEDAGR